MNISHIQSQPDDQFGRFRSRRARRLLPCLVVAAMAIGLVAVDVPTASAAPWASSLASADFGALARWSYNPASGLMSGTILDLTPNDGKCATVTAQGFSPVQGWAKPTLPTYACLGGSASFGFTAATAFRYTMSITVCNGSAQCRSTQPDRGCSPAYPERLLLETDTLQEYKYLDQITMCTDMAETTTTITNHTDLVWSIGRSDHVPPVVSYLNEPLSNQLFRSLRLGTGRNPLLLAQATAVISAPPSSIQLTVERALSVTWAPMDTLVDELVAHGVSSLAKLDPASKGWAAVVACGSAIFNFAKTSKKAVSPGDIEHLLLNAAGTALDGLTCASKLKAAILDRDGWWPKAVDLPDLKSILRSPEWLDRYKVLSDLLHVAEDLPHL